MKQELLMKMLGNFQKNLEELYTNAKTDGNGSVEKSSNLLSAAYKELGMASEEIQIAIENLVIQSEELASVQIHLEAEREHYKNLFEFLPDAYLITNPQGHVLQANSASSSLFNVESRFLINKPLDLFLAQEERAAFATKLDQLNRFRHNQKWTLRLQPRNGELLDVATTVAPNHNSEGKLISLQWCFRTLTENQQVQFWPENTNNSAVNQYSKYVYQQGEFIPLHPEHLWLVSQGWVKLSTITENAEEILVGLVGESMPFGSSLTSLPTYQATALSQKVQLICMPLTQVFNTPDLLETIVPQIIKRLQQTESLLAISGVRQVNERVKYLLQWLKTSFTQEVPQGRRLRVRLTHQELANACGTTRVTITRILGQLKQQGKITYDNKHHIIFLS